MAEGLRLVLYNTAGSEIDAITLSASTTPTTYSFFTRARTTSGKLYKDIINNSPTVKSRQLVDYTDDALPETIVVDMVATSLLNYQKGLAVLNQWTDKARQAQRKRNQGLPYNAIKLEDRALNTATYTSRAEVITMNVAFPETMMRQRTLFRCDNIVITLLLDPFWTASVLNLISAQAITNGAANKVIITSTTTDFTVTTAALTSNVATLTTSESMTLIVGETIVVANVTLDAAFNGTFVVTAVGANTVSYAKTNANIASASSTGTVTGQYIKGSANAPARIELAGGGTNTNRLYIAARSQGTVANFTDTYWAKDATMTSNTAARNTDTTFDGNGTTNGSRTTAANTSENKILRWSVTSNVADQYGTFRAFLRCRSNTAGRYTVRARVGLTDGTNVKYPTGTTGVDTGGYSVETAVTVTTDSGNALAWVDLGVVQHVYSSTVYGIIYEIYATCSNTTGSPTLDIDGLFLFPTNDAANGTGFTSTKYLLGTAAAGVSSAFVNAITPDNPSYLADSSDVMTFPAQEMTEGGDIWLEPVRKYHVYFALVDEATSAGNPRHDHSTALTINIDHELRQGAEGRVV